jgi:hypothetical protein
MLLSLLLLPALTTGCAPADAKTQVEEPAHHVSMKLLDNPYQDTQSTAASVQTVLDHVQSLPPDQRQELADAAAVLMVNCPYRRASAQLPMALHLTVSSIQPEDVAPEARAELAALQQGLALHVELLDAIGGGLATPTVGDALFDHAAPGTLIDADMLQSAADPMASTQLLVSAIPDLVDTLDDNESDRIGHNVETAYTYLDAPVLLTHQVLGWHYSLDALSPHVTDPAAQAQVQSMLRALWDFSWQGC